MHVGLTSGRAARVRRYLLGWDDLIMMRKQLLTLEQHAERSMAPSAPAGTQ